MDNYTVDYTATVRGCSDLAPQSDTITLPGSSRMVNITGLEENSDVGLTVNANNARGSTERPFEGPRRTTMASEYTDFELV